jgi:hypothetical protein
VPQLAIESKEIDGQYWLMAQNWTSRIAHKAHKLGTVFRTPPRLVGYSENDADARRIRSDLAAIRARFPDHA